MWSFDVGVVGHVGVLVFAMRTLVSCELKA